MAAGTPEGSPPAAHGLRRSRRPAAILAFGAQARPLTWFAPGHPWPCAHVAAGTPEGSPPAAHGLRRCSLPAAILAFGPLRWRHHGLAASSLTGTAPPTERSWPVPWLPPAGGVAEATPCSMAYAGQ